MAKYLKEFQTVAQYNAAKDSLLLPHISTIIETSGVTYEPQISIKNAVITCDSVTYNGETQIATNIVVVVDGKTLVSGTDYTVSGNTSGINAGNYTFTINGINNYVDSKNGVFTINKVTPTVVIPTANVLTYNGSAQELVTSGSTNWGTLKYSLDGTNYSTSIPTATNYGSYTVYYKVDGDSNVNDVAPATIACSINEKQVTATVELSQDTYTYDGTAKEPTVTVKDGSIVIDPSEYSVAYSNNVNAGTATVTISDNVGGNYEVIGNATYTINKANPTYTAPTTKTGLVYTGSAQNLLNAGSTSHGTIQYSSDNSSWSTTIPTGTNANTYTSYWRLVGDSNHNDVASASISTTIAKANQSAPTATGASVTYGNTATATASGGGGQGSIEWSNGNTLTGNVSSKTTSARWSGNGNYNASSWSNEVTLSITKANRTMNWSSAPSSVVKGKTVTATATRTGDGTITYSSSNTNMATINSSSGVITGVGNGTCTITASVPATTNYNSASTSYTLTCIDYAQRYLTFTATDSGTFKFSGNSISYSTNNGSSWTTLASNTNSPTVSAGSKIMWKATLTPTSNGIGRFSSTGRFTVEGNAMSLLYGDNFVGQTTLSGKDYAFYMLFDGCTGMTSAENLSLPATTLADYCYSGMFYGCEGLITVPSNLLPATTLANFCYYNMFGSCSDLTVAPQLPATTLANRCYGGMFSWCTKLTTPPVLPATTLADSCYIEMFAFCWSLTTAPVLPAATLVSRCYREMFAYCNQLNYIKAMFTTTPSPIYMDDWVDGVASSGTFVKNSAATWTESCGTSTYPCNWTVQTASS